MYDAWLLAGKELNDPRVLTDVGDVPVQEIRDCGVDDDRLMNVISESVKLVMEEVIAVFFFLLLILQFIGCSEFFFSAFNLT
jgi:ferritin-like protein